MIEDPNRFRCSLYKRVIIPKEIKNDDDSISLSYETGKFLFEI